MKRIFKFLVIMLSLSQCTQTQAQQVISRADKMNVLYVGVENPISIMANKIPIKEVSLEMANCAIKRIDDFHFTITPQKPNYKGEKLVFKHKGKVIGEEIYRIKSFPAPVARFGGISDEGMMSAGEFKAQSGIGCVMENMDICVKFRIESYRIRIVRDGVVIINKEFNGSPYFNDGARTAIEQVQSGDEVLFSDMKYKKDQGNETLAKAENSFIFIKINS